MSAERQRRADLIKELLTPQVLRIAHVLANSLTARFHANVPLKEQVMAELVSFGHEALVKAAVDYDPARVGDPEKDSFPAFAYRRAYWFMLGYFKARRFKKRRPCLSLSNLGRELGIDDVVPAVAPTHGADVELADTLGRCLKLLPPSLHRTFSLVAAGHQQREVAGMLGVSVSAVHLHMRRIRRMLSPLLRGRPEAGTAQPTDAPVTNPLDRLVRLKEVTRRLGCTDASIHRWVKAGTFPRPAVDRGFRKWKLWRLGDVVAWENARSGRAA